MNKELYNGSEIIDDITSVLDSKNDIRVAQRCSKIQASKITDILNRNGFESKNRFDKGLLTKNDSSASYCPETGTYVLHIKH